MPPACVPDPGPGFTSAWPNQNKDAAMKRMGWFCGAFGIMALLSSAASAAPARRVSYHDELAHRAYHRELAPHEAHRYPLTTRDRVRLHEVLAHEAYQDHHDHHVV